MISAFIFVYTGVIFGVGIIIGAWSSYLYLRCLLQEYENRIQYLQDTLTLINRNPLDE
jgi:hypothetical protein